MFYLLVLISSLSVMAAGNSDHHGHMTDLIPPAINFLILSSFLIYKLKKPIREMFVKKAQTITETLERANVKSREANMMFEAQQKKLNNLEKDIYAIQAQTNEEITNFKLNNDEETKSKSEKIKQDAILKLEAEKKALYESMNTKLVDSVIASARNEINKNNELKNKVNKKITQEIK